MITLIVYIIDGLVLGYFAFKVILSLTKTYNPFMFNFASVATLLCLNFVAYAVLILYSLQTKQPVYLYWADYFGRLFTYMGSAVAIQIPLYKIAPKRPERIWGSIIVGALGIFLAVFNLIHPNQPVIDSLQIIHWNSPAWLALGLAVMLIGIWLPTSVIFLLEFAKSKWTLTKSLYLGSGFLIGAIGASLQDFGTTLASYGFINALFLFGFILMFIGLFLKSPVKSKFS